MSSSLSRRLASFFVVCTSAAGVAPVSAEVAPLHADGRVLRDARGATVILRGLNLTGDAKVPPFRGLDDNSQLDVLPSWGVNVARLLFTWEAFEPKRGEYDQSYLDYYTGLVDALAERGVHVIVDFHQDAFSRYATQGCGEGFPEWAVSTKVRKDTPDNGPSCASWGVQMLLDPQTAQSWNDFYAGANGVRASYLSMLDKVSQHLKDKPILGYDMLNEPGGDEVKQIAPLYQDAAMTLRKNDPDAVLFVSPGALTSAGTATALPRPSFDNFVYSPHYYDAGVSQLHSWFGTSLAEPVRTMATQGTTWNVPVIVGEFGATGEGLRSDAYIDEFYTQLDANLLSAAQWNWTPHWTPQKKDGWNTEDFSITDDKGRPRSNYRVRAYPARIAGEAQTFHARYGGGASVELAWKHDPAAGETRVFAPAKALFNSKVSIQAADDLKCAYEENQLWVRCSADSAGNKRVKLTAER